MGGARMDYGQAAALRPHHFMVIENSLRWEFKASKWCRLSES